MNKDYNDFLQAKKTTPSRLDKNILNYVKSDLNPEHKVVFFKLMLIHGFIGIITMLFCPQFNFSLTNNFDLFHYFHTNFGHQVCMMICGCIFLGTGSIFATHILSQGEVNKIKSSRLLYFTALSIVAVSLFMLFGAKIYLNLVSFWLIGSILGSVIFFELNRLIKNKFLLS